MTQCRHFITGFIFLGAVFLATAFIFLGAVFLASLGCPGSGVLRGTR